MTQKQTTYQKHPRLIWDGRLCLSLTSWTSLCLLLQRGRESRNKDTVWRIPTLQISVTGKAQPMICMTRGIWAQTRQWITANVNCWSWIYRCFWDSHELQIALLLLKSSVVTGFPFNAHNHLNVLILLSLDTRLEPTTHFHKANSPVQGDKQKVMNQISFATSLLMYCSLAQKKKCFLLTSYSYSGFGVFALIFIRPSHPFFLCY